MVPEVSSTKSPLLGWRLHVGHHAAENTGTLSFSPPLKRSISTLGEGSLKDLKLLPTHPTDPSALQMGVSERSGPWSPLPGQEHWLSNFAWGNQRTWKDKPGSTLPGAEQISNTTGPQEPWIFLVQAMEQFASELCWKQYNSGTLSSNPMNVL